MGHGDELGLCRATAVPSLEKLRAVKTYVMLSSVIALTSMVMGGATDLRDVSACMLPVIKQCLFYKKN